VIVGTIVLDVSDVPQLPWTQRDHEDRYILSQLERLPDGIKVIIDVGARSLLGIGAMDYVHDNGERLDIEFRGYDITNVAPLVRMARYPTEVA
jgi:hypothetical protein